MCTEKGRIILPAYSSNTLSIRMRAIMKQLLCHSEYSCILLRYDKMSIRLNLEFPKAEPQLFWMFRMIDAINLVSLKTPEWAKLIGTTKLIIILPVHSI